MYGTVNFCYNILTTIFQNKFTFFKMFSRVQVCITDGETIINEDPE